MKRTGIEELHPRVSHSAREWGIMQFDLTIREQIKLKLEGVGVDWTDRGILELLHEDSKQFNLLAKHPDGSGPEASDMSRQRVLERLNREHRCKSGCEI